MFCFRYNVFEGWELLGQIGCIGFEFHVKQLRWDVGPLDRYEHSLCILNNKCRPNLNSSSKFGDETGVRTDWRATWRLLLAPATVGSGAQKVQGCQGGVLFVVCSAYFYNRESHSGLCVGMLPHTRVWSDSLLRQAPYRPTETDRQLRVSATAARVRGDPGSNLVLVIG